MLPGEASVKKVKGKSRSAAYWRAAPPLAFIVAICLLLVFCYEFGYSSLPPTEKRYVAAKAGIASLRQDVKKNKLREPWEKLATEFRSIYDGDPSWPNRPAALFRAAESLEELARRSYSRSDARKAINCYETLALRHAESRLADDALLRAAQMRAAWLKDDAGALALLARIKKQYPKGDMINEAAALEKALRASANGKTAPEAVKAAGRSSIDTLDAALSEKSGFNKKENFAGDLPLRFKAAKSRMESLRKDTMRACWRQPWENLRDEFLRINKAAGKTLAPQALYNAAEAQRSLAICSRLSNDASKALDLYQKVASTYPKHALADDALLNAARLQYESRSAQVKSQADNTLERIISQYAKGDKVAEARKLLTIWRQTSSGAEKVSRKNRKEIPELQVLSWDSKGKNNVEIVLEMSAPTAYGARLEKAQGASPARLVVELENASVVDDIRKGVNVNGSLLKAVRVNTKKDGGAILQFDLRDARKFDVRKENDPHRIIVNIAAGKAQLPKSSGSMQASKQQIKAAQEKIKATHVADMASQLGLTVKRVFIDAGHGGKDPGTSHNKITERAVTLDVALMLGRLLEANGFEVMYTRKSDKSVALSERTRMANSAGADLFISIHVNAHDNPSSSGFETYYLDLATNQQAARVAMQENAASDRRLGDMNSMLTEVMLHAKAQESRRLAADIQRVTMFRLKKRDYATRNNGVKSAPFHVLLGARMPAVLVEIGYCSNSVEARNLANASYRHALAEGLAEGIMAYRDRLLRNRTAGKTLTGAKAGAI